MKLKGNLKVDFYKIYYLCLMNLFKIICLFTIIMFMSLFSGAQLRDYSFNADDRVFSAGMFQSLPEYQSFPDEYYHEYSRINRFGMFTLAGWSVMNIGTGVYFQSKTTLSALHYLWQGNVYWNVVNFGLASVSIVSSGMNKKHDYTFQQIIRKQHQTEKLFLLNTGLDVAYIFAGLYLNERAAQHDTDGKLAGYGTALMFQGSFLLLFDAAMYVAHRLHARHKLDPVIEKLNFIE